MLTDTRKYYFQVYDNENSYVITYRDERSHFYQNSERKGLWGNVINSLHVSLMSFPGHEVSEKWLILHGYSLLDEKELDNT